MEVLIIVALLIVLIALGIQVAYALALTAIVGTFLFLGGMDGVMNIAGLAFGELNDFVLVAVPLFLLMAQILLHGGVGRDLFKLGAVWLQHLPGGLAVATIVACAIFSAVSGSSVATALTVGSVAYPELTSRGYSRGATLGAIAAGGTLGILIPPSIPLILFGAVTGLSVGQLFTAGLAPGVLLTGLFAAYVSYRFRGGQYRVEAASWGERLTQTRKSGWGLLVPLVVVLGIYLGWFTPTEAAAVGVVMALIVTVVVYRRMSFGSLTQGLRDTAKDSGMILMIIIGALLFGRVLTALRVPQEITRSVAQVDINRWLILIIIMLLLLVMGMFLEVISILLISIPVLYPVITALGFDPIWFAIIFVINMEMALLTPPVGLNLFVVQGISGESAPTVVRGTMPFFGLMAVALILVAVFPMIATGLVQTSP